MRELTKLRRRFILILMCSVGLVLTIALAVSVIGSYSTQYGRIQNSLSAALGIEQGEELRPHIGGSGTSLAPSTEIQEAPLGSNSVLLGGENDKEFQAIISNRGNLDMVPVYVIDILFDTGDITIYGNATNMADETLQIALSRIKASSDTNGLFLDLGLFYQLETGEDGLTRIAFADASQIFDNTLYLGLMALLVWLAAMVVFFILSLLLSRMALRPVEDAWTKQREFIADASHELKTPLTIILANNNIVMAHPERSTQEQQQWLESTQEEATRMDGLISDLLLLAQMDHAEEAQVQGDYIGTDEGVEAGSDGSAGSSGNTAPDFAPLDLSALVERSLLQFDAVFFERNISLQSEIQASLKSLGNAEHLRRLVTILLDNASKYGNEGGVVDLKLMPTPEKPKRALLTVSNTGAYIPPEKIDRVFDRFFRGDAAHSSATPGNGLGLALAKEIVGEHNGTISLTSTLLASEPPTNSEPLATTTFYVSLPLI